MAQAQYRPHKSEVETRADGAILYRSSYELSEVAQTTGDWLHKWAKAAPDRVFVAERFGAGWREVTYREALEQVRAIGAALMARGLGPQTPIIIMSGNSVDHALLSLAGQYVGVPVVPVAEQYALIHGAHGRLKHAIELTKPKMAFVDDADKYAEALKLPEVAALEVVASRGATGDITPFDALLQGAAAADADAAHAKVGPESVVKILLTSGSTSAPKGVPTTHRMMCVNQAQILDALPFLADRPPVVCDWLPWNHVFGGSHNLNIILANGGTFYIDDGKPVPALMPRTIENLSMVSPTLSFNVPVGFAGLLEALKKSETLRETYFKELDMIFYAGASLPQEVWVGFESMAKEVRGMVPLMNSSWGLTETAPATLMVHEPTRSSGIVGVPLTGVEIKLLPDDEMRCEVRVKGPNLFTAYLDSPEKSAEAFDDEGYFITGDAMRFVDNENPDLGLRFDGRISEDFKLLTGTWVRAAQLRLDMLAWLGPLVQDLVITGADRGEIGLMIFPNMAELTREGFARDADRGALTDPKLKSEISRKLAERARDIQGSSTKISRAIVLSEPADMGAGEVTAKGNLNYRKVLDERKDLLERLYDNADPATITF
ncbi:MAG: feruloyl-CoA synthase [Maritimibacter sp.]